MGQTVQDLRKPASTKVSQEPVILVVTRNSYLTEALTEYSLGLAGRLNHRLLVAYVNTMPFLGDGGYRSRRFTLAVNDNGRTLKKLSEDKGVILSHVKESGKVSRVISRLCRIVKKIELIVIDDDIPLEEIVMRAPVPVFTVDKLITT